MKYEYAIIIKNQTRLEKLVRHFNVKSQAKFYIERQGGDFDDYAREDEIFQQSLGTLQQQLGKVIKNKIVERTYLPSFIFSKKHLIVVIGQDGLVANTAKYAQGLPIIGVNPDKKRYDGILLPFDTSNFVHGIEQVLSNSYRSRTMRFAEAKLNDGQRLLAFNDLFIGAASHVSARYTLNYNKQTETHSSSGLIVSTKAGSTGWLSSVFNMAHGIMSMLNPELQLQQPEVKDNELLFAVREPFKSIRSQTGITCGLIKEQNQLLIESLMPQNGVIFSDGIEHDFLKFNSGAIASIGTAEEKAELVLNQ